MEEDTGNPTHKSQTSAHRCPYLGQCHCGTVKYITWLTFPAEVPDKRTTPLKQLLRKCNCTMCHKTGFLHIRLPDAPNDFALLSPLNPLEVMTSYQPTNRANWLFCKTCGVRCFLLEGEGEVKEINLAGQGVDLKRASIHGDETMVKVFRPKSEGWKEEETTCFRVNAHTLGAKQEGLDMREWKENKWIQYVNWLEEIEGGSYERPFISGCY